LQKSKNILVCPLDWGIGHASRLIPIITEFIKNNNEVIIAGSGKSLLLLKTTFPKLRTISIEGYNIKYSKTIPLSLKMIFQAPKILIKISKEHKQLEKIIKEQNIDIVVSDNRFGLWSKMVKSIYITHQIMIKMPGILKFLEYPIYRFHKKTIKKYDECWIPDIEQNPNIAGDLTRKFPLPENAKCIGILSRFKKDKISDIKKKYEILIILSGPEPQRTIFENILIEQISKTDYKTLLVRGLNTSKLSVPDNIDVVSHLNTNDMKDAILSSDYIISRSGYSTIMDLIVLEKNAIIVPTPGQTEQEYLAKYYKDKKIFYSVKQKDFCISSALKEVEQYNNKFEISETKLQNIFNH